MNNDITNEQLEKIANLAKELHKGQTRKNGDDYFTHLERVAFSCKKYKNNFICAIAYLHDSIEDKVIDKEDLTKELTMIIGYPMASDMVSEVIMLDKKNLTEDEYITGVYNDEFARLVKICDICDNLSDQPSAKARERYLRQLDYLTFKKLY